MDSLTPSYNGETEAHIKRSTAAAATAAVKRKESLQSYKSELDRSSDSNKGKLCHSKSSLEIAAWGLY
jgi:hypothetical protein